MSQIVLASDQSFYDDITKIDVIRLNKIIRVPKRRKGKKPENHLIFSRFPEAERKYGAKRLGSFWVVKTDGIMSQISIRSAKTYLRKGYPTAIVID